MNNKAKIIVIIITVLMIILVAVPVVYVQGIKIKYANRVTEYLLEEQKYNKEEIESVKGVWGIKLPAFYAVVIFKDEPEVEYIYFAHHEVMQFDYRLTEEGKLIGIVESDLKHFEKAE